MKTIDLRSDTVTRPSEGMRKAMYTAEVGDDVFNEDPTANKLQIVAADLLEKEAALFVPSGVMGNQICLNVLTNPGDEVLCERDAHIFNYESGSPAALSGIQMTPIVGEKGVMDPKDVEENIRPADAYYMPRTKVIAIENTHNRAGGTIQPMENISALKKVAEKYNLFFHLDGARLWNASAESGITLKEYSGKFDTVSCCLSKGLGAPVGSVIFGSKDFINKAFRIRKAFGGGMRQIGILAAAGLYALQHNLPKLKEDHQKAKMIAEAISKNENLEINLRNVQTNIVIFKSKKYSVEESIKKCREKGLLISDGKPGFLRAITHLDVSFEEIEKSVKILQEVFEG